MSNIKDVCKFYLKEELSFICDKIIIIMLLTFPPHLREVPLFLEQTQTRTSFTTLTPSSRVRFPGEVFPSEPTPSETKTCYLVEKTIIPNRPILYPLPRTVVFLTYRDTIE